jgi:hypothetical protein
MSDEFDLFVEYVQDSPNQFFLGCGGCMFTYWVCSNSHMCENPMSIEALEAVEVAS